MNFFLANCLQEDNKCAGKKATYAETGQNNLIDFEYGFKFYVWM